MIESLGEHTDILNRVNRLDRPGLKIRMTNRVTGLSVSADPVTHAVTVSFQATSLTGIGRFQLLRNTSRDPGSARMLNEWTYESLFQGAGQAFPLQLEYTDADPAIIGQVAFYWIKIVPAAAANRFVGRQTGTLIGPQSADQTGITGAPSQAADFSVSHAAAVNGIVAVSVNFTPADSTFASLKIYVSGYLGQADKVAVAQQAETSFTFNLQQTGETPTFYAVPVGVDGIEAPIGAALTKTLTLGAGATVPTKPMNASAIAIPSGIQISFPANPEGSGITQYQIFRGQRQQGFANASSIGTVAPSGSSSYVFLDGNGLTGRFEYYIVAVNGAGSSAASAAIVDGQSSLTSADQPTNAPANSTNFATVDSIDAGSDATIRIYGTGGVGSSWTRPTGFGTETYPTGTILHKSYTTTYYVIFDRIGLQYLAFTSLPGIMPDNYAFAGKVTTVASGGSGGTSGGGGGTGGGGGRPPNQ